MKRIVDAVLTYLKKTGSSSQKTGLEINEEKHKQTNADHAQDVIPRVYEIIDKFSKVMKIT